MLRKPQKPTALKNVESIDSIADLKAALAAKNQIVIKRDKLCSMALVEFNGLPVMGGNFWDFHPGCHGGWFYTLAESHGDFRSPEGLAITLQSAAAALGSPQTEITSEAYEYGVM